MKAVLITLIAGLVAVVIGLAGWLYLERQNSSDLTDRLTVAEQKLEAYAVNREVITKLDRDQREVSRKVDEAVRRAETVTDAIDEIERLEGR